MTNKHHFNFERITEFLKVDCKIDIGFEAQLVGVKAKSATTTGLIIYVLASLGALTEQERLQYINEIQQFKIKDGFSDVYGTNYPCSWATMQVALALMAIGEEKEKIKNILDVAIQRYHLPSGAWCFSREEDEKLVYSIYPIIALKKAYQQYVLDYSEVLLRTANYLSHYMPNCETEKVLVFGLLSLIKKLDNRFVVAELPYFHVDYSRIIKEEFGKYGVNEYTIYPFSMKLYTPALYLLARNYLPLTHPFCRYLLVFLRSNIIDNKAWMHVSPDSPRKLCSYCTALSLLTLYRAYLDYNNAKLDMSSLLFKETSLKELEVNMENIETPIRLFISYSSKDEQITSRATERLKKHGFDVTYAEFDLLVGDSIPGFINDGLHKMDYFIIFLSNASVASKFVKDEFAGAKSKEWLKERVVILPALLEKCDIPPLLAAKKWADFSTSFETGIQQIIDSVRRHHAKRKGNP